MNLTQNHHLSCPKGDENKKSELKSNYYRSDVDSENIQPKSQKYSSIANRKIIQTKSRWYRSTAGAKKNEQNHNITDPNYVAMQKIEPKLHYCRSIVDAENAIQKIHTRYFGSPKFYVIFGDGGQNLSFL